MLYPVWRQAAILSQRISYTIATKRDFVLFLDATDQHTFVYSLYGEFGSAITIIVCGPI